MIDKKKKTTKKCSQENYQRDLQLKYYGDSQIGSTKDKEKEGRKKIEDNENISWDKKT